MDITVYILSIIFIITPFFPATGNPHWFFRTPDFIRIQSIIVQLALLAIHIMWIWTGKWMDWVIAGLLVSAIFYQLEKIYPYSSLSKRRDSKSPEVGRLSILAANVLQTNTSYDDFISIVERYEPDLVLTMESNQDWEAGISQIKSDYPYVIEVPNDNFYGMHVYSRQELENVEIHGLVEAEIPSIFFEYQIVDNKKIFFMCLHPTPPSPTERETSKERDTELMIAGRYVRSKNMPTVVCGDMNDVVWSRTTRLFRKMTGMIDPRVGRGFYSTFHARYWFLRFPLDHLFHTKDIFIGRMERSEYFGSDHFAMYYEIYLKQNSKHEIPPLKKKDQSEIVGTIEKSQD